MTRHDRYLFRLWLARWGFALMVAAAILVGLAAAVTVAAPPDIPTVALRAAPVYRVEVGGAVFFCLYVAGMAFALSLRNRGFTEIGSGGVRAQDMAAASDDVAAEVEASTELLTDVIDEIDELRTMRREGQIAH
jgi:hypothetical protein